MERLTWRPGLDPDFEVPDPDEVVCCSKCGSPLPASNYYIYDGKEFHKNCIPEEARKVATERI